MNERTTNVLSVIGYIYLIISQIMTIYFWWQYAHEHGFWGSIFIAPFVAEFKGILWVFFIW
jgi:hypothetical protein